MAGVILSNYNNNDVLFIVDRWIFTLVVGCMYTANSFSFSLCLEQCTDHDVLVLPGTVPLMFYACKKSIFSLFFPDLEDLTNSSTTKTLKAHAISICVLVVVVCISILVESVSVILAYLGSLTGNSLVYVQSVFQFLIEQHELAFRFLFHQLHISRAFEPQDIAAGRR